MVGAFRGLSQTGTLMKVDGAISAAVTSHPAEPPPPCGEAEEGFESDKEDAPLDASVLERLPVHLVPLADIRPTQLAVGMQQVSEDLDRHMAAVVVLVLWLHSMSDLVLPLPPGARKAVQVPGQAAPGPAPEAGQVPRQGLPSCSAACLYCNVLPACTVWNVLPALRVPPSLARQVLFGAPPKPHSCVAPPPLPPGLAPSSCHKGTLCRRCNRSRCP